MHSPQMRDRRSCGKASIISLRLAKFTIFRNDNIGFIRAMIFFEELVVTVYFLIIGKYDQIRDLQEII